MASRLSSQSGFALVTGYAKLYNGFKYGQMTLVQGAGNDFPYFDKLVL